jgi:hypothetical protein
MSFLSRSQERNAAIYDLATPKQLGDLHERMKFVMKALEEARGWKTSEPDQEFDEMYHDLVWGLIDLETEVKHYTPARPPCGRRASRTHAR